MKTCEEYEALISAFLDGELSGEERAETAAHLAACPVCQQYFDDLVAIHDALDREEAPLPEGFAGTVMARVRETPQEKPEKKVIAFPHWKRWAAMAACCAFAALGLWAFQARGGDARESGQVMLARSAPSPEQYADAPACAEADEGMEAEALMMDDAEEGAPNQKQASPTGNPPKAEDGAAPAAEYCMEDAVDSHAVAPAMSADQALTGTMTAGGETARAWVERELGLPWEAGRQYPLTAEQFSALLDELNLAGEDFRLEAGESCLLTAE